MTFAALGVAACGFSGRPPVQLSEVRKEARASYMAGDFIAASRLFREAVAADPGDSLSYGYLADTFRRAGWANEGYRFFRDAGDRKEPRAPELRYYLAFFAAYTGQIDSAAFWLAEARRTRPPSYPEAVALSDILLLHRRIDVALELLEDAARRFPDRAEARIRLVTTLGYLGRHAEARAKAEELVRDFPKDPGALATMAQLRYMTGDLPAAQEFTRRWLIFDPQDAEARWNLARIALRRGEWTQADSLLRGVLETGG